ncbi:hypothetical protein DPMN_000908 [Dreissena polymorpha]|uniref:FYVE zinc finger domain-containing protein n=1 Tax=Dreissena polymorpha TaxID=45954 RepID=A0A9D4RSK2_DREPO|nr:hypothetical protein DPMN_000908 [Dreissena polymorpha]
MAKSDPAGIQRKVCISCFEGDIQDDGITRNLTTLFTDERKMARYARVLKQRNNSLTNTFWRDQLNVKNECLRLLNGFRSNVKQSESHRTLQEIRGAIKTPDWQKAPAWEPEMQASTCRACKGNMGIRKSSGNCRVCGLALCWKCSNKDLLLYYPDNYLQNANVTCEPMLAIINQIGASIECIDNKVTRARLLCQESALCCLHGLTGRHKPSTRTPEWFPEHVERSGYRRPSSASLSLWNHPLKILACISAQGPPGPSSTLSPPLLPPLFRRCSETTIYLRTITIPLSDPSKLRESAKSAVEDFRVEGVSISDPPQAM